MKRRNLILLLGGASSGAMSVGTGAFSSVEAERGVAVNVVEDDEAYLGLDVENRIATVGRAAEVVEITNSFTDTLSLDVTVEHTNDVVDEIVVGDEDPGDEFSVELDPGESEWISIICGRLEEAEFKLRFDGNTEGATVEKTRRFRGIDCLVSEVIFNGDNGSVRIKGDFSDLKVLINGDQRSETVTAGKNGVVIDRSDGKIERVTIGRTVYQR
jgi:hypothetical protein